MTRTVLVTGATGKVGRHVVRELLGKGHRVRAVSRNPHEIPGVEVFRADLNQPESLTEAAEECDEAFLLWPYGGTDSARTPAILAALGAIRHVVALSSRGVRDDVETQSDSNSQFHADIESAIERSGLAWTFLRPGGFDANTLMWAEQIKARVVVRAPYGALSRPLIHERDIAAVAVAALTTDGHAGARYILSGPASLTQIEQVATIGEVIGRPVQWEELSPAAARPLMLADGWPPALADGALSAWQRMLANPETPTSTVEDVTGVAPRSFADWVREHAAAFS